MSEKKLRFGILGCGLIADFHANALRAIEYAELVGAADNSIERAKQYAERYDIKAYANYEEMLADDKIDAVCICTPSGFHAENAIQALKANKHVVLEKPMALTVEDTEKIIAETKKTNKLLTVISQLRFSKDVNRVKNLVKEGAFGQLVFCDLNMRYWREPTYYSSSPWKGTIKMDGGGALMNQGVHGIDLMLYIAGDAKVVKSVNRTAFHDIEVEDASVSILQFENGAMGTVSGSTCTYPGFERTFEILGTEGCAILRENKIEKLVVHGETLIDGIEEEGFAGGTADPAAIDTLVHKKQLKNFIKAVFGEEELLIDATEGKRAVKLIREIYTNK